MYRTALRHSASRPIIHSLRSTPRAPCRFASTASPAQSRSWKSSAVRWGLAVAAVYYYNVSSTFADDSSSQSLDPSVPYGDLPTVDSVVQRRRESAKSTATEKPAESKLESEEATQDQTVAAQGLPAEEAGQDGAFNPETGEINWDCPCLGGMAHGPCGEDFKTAFSCFVYSTEEPKGMDCIEKFQSMQECFRKYPDIYGAELDDAESEAAEPAAETEPVQSLDPVEPASTAEKTEAPVAEFQTLREAHPAESEAPKESPAIKPAKDAADAKPWTDTTAANEGRDEKR